MATELSSNWKKLQAQIQAESTTSSTTNPTARKRKATQTTTKSSPPAKRQKSKSLAAPAPQLPGRPVGNAKARARIPNLSARMGAGQSSKIDTGPSPSLASWAAENDISPESLAEAYGLGLRNNSLLTSEKEKVNAGLTEGLEVGKYIAIDCEMVGVGEGDCEMVGVGEGGYESALARVSVVDFHGRQVYDSYVKPRERVADWRTAITGLTPKHMRSARDFHEVQAQVAELLRDRILIGHDVKHDLDALKLSHSVRDIRDTSKFPGFRQYGNGRKPALARLAKEILGVEIQSGAHSSVEDAKVAMALFRRHKPAFDVDHANRFPMTTGTAKPRAKKTKKKKK
ncbi:hypothetical protein SODALDRAFT_326043 [Sodiomyces alkalinus F11]|uniref:RNA exonuclease 4 n=1 Tax=Sodiomyces alkalinus (strain CBS 110278 / VKM F-3762 / F11) TaxID=1314773 RepID=A0A3N2Q583_SODAK|nr:hypothetical protein SODALDRAFT_326043 [Sodiomyces alkalinus F11]ROT41857.1 hypothetical protein SODALDRAFT_326043 [Sodiomyces alkalinus F11]